MYLRGFSSKPVLGIVILKYGLFRGFFFSLGWQPCEEQKNPLVGKDPRISKLKGSLP
jgi:hypothetical protein